MASASSSVKEAQGVYITDHDTTDNNQQAPVPVHVSTIEVGDYEETFLKGEQQPPAYQDLWFARAFYLQLIGVMVTAVIYAPAAASFQEDDTDEGGGDSKEGPSAFFLVLLIAVLFVAAMASTLSLFSAMTQYADRAVTLSFVAAPALLIVWALIFCVLGGTEGVEMGLHLLFFAVFFALISACLYHAYKSKIPFAASTLKAALSALELNKGLLLLSLGSVLLAFAWSALWVATIVGIVNTAQAKGTVSCLELYPTQTDVYQVDQMCDTHPPNGAAILFLILSFYWTHQVISNSMHCTTAGTVGSWWFSGFGDPSLCSRDVTDALTRTMTYSFGSICFGSLIVAIMQTLEAMARSARRNRRGAFVACLLECVLHFLRRWFEYFNSWAFVYVGLYGYDYRTAGSNVMTLFQQRGWSSFVADRLVFRVLYSTKLVVGICCGGVAAMVDIFAGPLFPDMGSSADGTVADDDQLDPIFASHILSFYIGALVGLITSSISLFVIESAVRSVIVCFAESPAEFQEHHPQLCDEMRAGWASAYPDVWNNGDYNERFVKATVVTFDEDSDPLYAASAAKV